MKKAMHMHSSAYRPSPLMPLLLTVLSLLLPGVAQAQAYTDHQRVERSFELDRESTLELQNKYGSIEINTWEKDSLRIEASIYLSESSKAKLRKLKEDVRIDFSGTRSYIIVKTKIESESGRIASELRSVGHTLTGENKRMEINYTIHAPAYLDVTLDNKFGDIYIDELDGQTDITLSNGALKANRMDGIAQLKLSFANGMINSLGSSTLQLSYSDLSLGKVNQLDIKSRSSKLSAESIKVLKMDSRRDRLKFKAVEYFYGKSSFTQIHIQDFRREVDIYMNYGKLNIARIESGFSNVFIESSYTDLNLKFNPSQAFSFDILHHERAILHLPVEGVQSQSGRNGKDHLQTSGKMGTGTAEGKLRIDALQKCFINLAFNSYHE